MSNNESSSCIELQESAEKKGLYSLAELLPEECCSVKIPFHALTPGKYKIQAQFTYNEGKLEPLTVTTEVNSTLEAELNIGIVMIAYTLTRLSLNFTLSSPT